MFTGIIEACARVEALEQQGGVLRLALFEPALAPAVGLGDSVAVNGACLTIAERHPQQLRFDAVPETLARTTLGALEVGARVNLERALRADARLDGHFVQGHIDETGEVKSLERAGDDVRLRVATTPGFAGWLVEKGSVAVDGVSLTVTAVATDGFEVALIPHTLEATALGALSPGSRVNLEADLLGKYLKRYLERVSLPSLEQG